MTRAAITQPEVRDTMPNSPSARGLHVTFIVVWACLLLGAILAFFCGVASDSRTYDSGPLTHEAQAGVDYLAAGILAATGLIVVMVQVGARIVQLSLHDTRGA